jgi:hypothetical protein
LRIKLGIAVECSFIDLNPAHGPMGLVPGNALGFAIHMAGVKRLDVHLRRLGGVFRAVLESVTHCGIWKWRLIPDGFRVPARASALPVSL